MKFQVRVWLLKCYPKFFHKLQILLINLIVSGLEDPQKKIIDREKFELSHVLFNPDRL